ncbi:hypothetical protein ILT44_24155 [Microvirga sp. BT689]|uniref:hypothetical protein n=1 Tax=Microvirga arvi TaxID=2778731 RepID=UPI001950BD90|nr:hypothetical protein [Microvirga arvi]MBM6583299.1 hypothetical protein [Microvirga arvi]
MAGRALLYLEKLPLDRAHSRHQPVQLGKQLPLILSRLLDQLRGCAMANPMQGIGQFSVEKPHVMLQVQEFLVKLGLLEHVRSLA